MSSLQSLIRSYDAALPAPLCTQLIALFENNPSWQQRNGAGVRSGLEASAWTEMDLARTRDATLAGQLLSYIHDYYQRYNQDCGFSLPISPPAQLDRWIIKRYRPSGAERFQPHFDSVGPVCFRYLVFLWYLNDVSEGGQTAFPDLDTHIDARQGRLLMFPPYWMFQHQGLAPRSGDKYILSTYLRY